MNKIFTVEQHQVVCGEIGGDFSSCSRSEFVSSTGVELPEEILSAAYEPNRNLFHVETSNGVSVFSSPEEHDFLNAVHENFETVFAKVMDFEKLRHKPSDFHVYDYDAHVWTISSENQLLLDASNVRSERDKLLSASDWTQSPDSPLSDDEKSSWATYRQELRDVTEQAGFPTDINWPSAP